MIDLHCHVLPGIDDGPGTGEESLQLVRAAGRLGVQRIVATSHVSARYPNDAATIARLAWELNERLHSEGVPLEVEGVPLEVLPGAEIALARLLELADEELCELRLGGGEWLLVEPPFSPMAPGLEGVLADLQRQGHRIVLAHPERCPAFHRDPEMLLRLVRGGAITSVTAGSLVGRFGADVRNFALDMAGAGLLHNVASDAHDPLRRPPGMAAECARAGLGWLADWLTREVPAAILAGGAIPPRPVRPPDGGGGWRRLWRAGRPQGQPRVSRWPGAGV